VARRGGLVRLGRGPVAGQDAIELAARAGRELGEDLAQVELDRARADEQPGPDLRVRQAVAGQPRNVDLLEVSSPVVWTVRLRAISPVASSSRLARSPNARSPNACTPIASSMSQAVGSCWRAPARRRSWRSHSP
jgi:hypothetical protein